MGVRACLVDNKTALITWNPVPCVHRNGDITGYKIQVKGVYGKDKPKTIQGDKNKYMYPLYELIPGRTYEVALAAINAAGTGPYSMPIKFTVPGNSYMYTLCMFLGSGQFPNCTVQTSDPCLMLPYLF